jgi:hypothetical protein
MKNVKKQVCYVNKQIKFIYRNWKIRRDVMKMLNFGHSITTTALIESQSQG